MILLDEITLNRLKDNYRAGRRSVYLIKMKIGEQWVYITDADTEIEFGGAAYQPRYIDDESVDDIETTSEPKTNDLTIELDANENSFVALFLNEGWMNGPVTVYEQHRDELGVILTKNVFEGLIDSRDLDPEKKKISEVVASVWADFEKSAGIKTNTKSQQRFYSSDTAFDHVARAKRKIYWGRQAPSSLQEGGFGGGGDRFQPPREQN